MSPIGEKVKVILINNPLGLTIKEITNELRKSAPSIVENQVERTLYRYKNSFQKSEENIWRLTSIIEEEKKALKVSKILKNGIQHLEIEELSNYHIGRKDDLRDNLIEEVRKDIIGPSEEQEILLERPNVYYLGAMLYPSNNEIQILDGHEMDREDDSRNLDDEQTAEEETQINRFYPSSLGLTCNLSEICKSVKVNISFGIYNEEKIEKKKGYKRTNVQKQLFIHTENKLDGTFIDEYEVQLKWFIRETSQGRSFSIFLVNRYEVKTNTPVEEIVFQPVISLEGNEEDYPFVRRDTPINSELDDDDIKSFKLLYRDRPEFAVGHGCAVEWENFNSEKAKKISTTFLPSYEIPAVQHLELKELTGLEMKVLAYVDDPKQMKVSLLPLVEKYESWIEELREIKIEKEYKDQREVHIENCKKAAKRIREGLEILTTNSDAFEAFKFANEIMLYQRSYSLWAQDFRKTGVRIEDPETTEKLEGRWRPFQLAFVLLNIKSIVDPTCEERDWADLLWFPTGGGKTEAYLGLAAFVLALRRLRGKEKGIEGYAGTTILMRYTLRLLTIQQFQRAASLICAAEYLRSKNPVKWGTEEFSIGLWVGGGTTPNSLSEAKDTLKDLQSGKTIYEANPVQLHHCPRCGEALKPDNYSIENDVFQILCSNSNCYFSINRIPTYTVDEAIYYRCPSILIGTVDKFARLPWNGNIATLFGKVDRYCQRHGFIRTGEHHAMSHTPSELYGKSETKPIGQLLPPELIIQDELHLISGPLGSMVGLYETAIDYLSMYEREGNIIRPKVVASTATIRGASQQVQGVFNRDVCQFPPSGIDAGNSFFSREIPTDVKPGRKYVGLYLPGTSGKSSTVRLYSALLQSAYRNKEEEIDPYWTLVGYFNSLRELGGTLRLVEDDIPDRIRYLAKNKEEKFYRKYLNTEELTSRIQATEIPKILTKLEQPNTNKRAVDVLLSTNMISVGVDIDRLGLMVVTGQPKGTSEYIQATSRVGRKYPGLVFTMYNWSRPRDISHFEQFTSYHSKIYTYVEATSVTPFSYRSRDKALPAIVIGMLRQLDETLFKNSFAKFFSDDNEYLDEIKSVIVQRCRNIEKIDHENIEKEIDKIVKDWIGRIEEHPEILEYSQHQYSKSDVPVLIKGINQETINGAILVPDSLRDVEAEVNINYLDEEEE
ncbi:DISARM system helicase DrmA [Alkalihalobacillus sp. BA299]|uniref:DISARM system helicase DrmA n=1 Tax=Alkalihalobacillus sp. BA299 TaxID=2815938 RepID=UPI001ADC1ACD|nr:DISARM system helicase DrmA [Alkalihalobacillus sp. BA299]